MDKIFLVKKDFVNSRIDRWIKRNICQVPQGLLEKCLRNKNIHFASPHNAPNVNQQQVL